MRIEIAFVVFHNYIQKLLIVLLCRGKSSKDSHGELALEHRHDLDLSVLVLGVLKDLLYCDYLSSSD